MMTRDARGSGDSTLTALHPLPAQQIKPRDPAEIPIPPASYPWKNAPSARTVLSVHSHRRYRTNQPIVLTSHRDEAPCLQSDLPSNFQGGIFVTYSRRIMLPFPEKAVGFKTLMMIMHLIHQEFRIIDTRTSEKINSPKIAT